MERQRAAMQARLDDVSAALASERVALEAAQREVKSLEGQLRKAAGELRDSCEQLTAASLALTAAAAENAEKDAAVTTLNVRVAELEDAMAAEAEKASSDLAAAVEARAPPRRRRTNA